MTTSNGIATRMNRFGESASARASQTARALAAAGRDILRLTTGEPDFPTPEHVKRAAIEAMRREQTKYTNIDGTPELKLAVAAKFRRENGLTYAPEEILVGAGAKQVIFNAMMATLDPGDEVLVPLPYYVSYMDIASLAEGVAVPVACAPGNGFRMRPEDLAAAITPRTRWLVLNSPCNPTGAVYSADELKAFAAVLAGHPRVWVLSDDIYEHILFDGAKFATPAQAAPELFERTLTVNGVSKAYAMTGWRIGYGGGPKHLIKAMAKVQSQVTHAPCSISQAAAIAALEGPQDYVAEQSRMFQQRRDFVVEAINKIPGLSVHVPQGAFYVFPSCAGVIGRRTPDGQVLATDKDFAQTVFIGPFSPHFYLGAPSLSVRWFRHYRPHRLIDGRLELYSGPGDFISQTLANVYSPDYVIMSLDGKLSYRRGRKEDEAVEVIPEITLKGSGLKAKSFIVVSATPAPEANQWGISAQKDTGKPYVLRKHAYAIVPLENGFYVLTYPATERGFDSYVDKFAGLIGSFTPLTSGPAGAKIRVPGSMPSK